MSSSNRERGGIPSASEPKVVEGRILRPLCRGQRLPNDLARSHAARPRAPLGHHPELVFLGELQELGRPHANDLGT